MPRLRRTAPVALLLAAALAAPASAAMTTPKFTRPVEGFAAYQPQTTCSPTAKPGVTRLSAMVLKAYAGTSNAGIVRACSLGGRSEHKEGRAWDWHVSALDPKERAQAYDFLRWLFATDSRGVKAANARRLGVMYVIFDRRIWGAYDASAGWRAYTGRNPHTDHMHISFSWAGARAQTSFWAGAVPAPAPRPVAAPAPPRTAEPPAPFPKPAKPPKQRGPVVVEDDAGAPEHPRHKRERDKAKGNGKAKGKGKGHDRAAERRDEDRDDD